MTLVAAWFNNESNNSKSVWTASDTKITFENGATLEGNKLFELNVVCKNFSSEPGKIEFSSKLIFAYAGSSMLAVNTYATLNTILSNLGGGNAVNPRRPDCVSIIGTALAVLKNHNESIQKYVEFLISGVCPKTNRLFIGRITARKAMQAIDYNAEVMYNDSDDVSFMSIGSHLNEIDLLINEKLTDKGKVSNHVYWRTPLFVLNELIVNQTYDEIGGNIQLGMVQLHGATQLFAVSPNIYTDPINSKYQNININQIGTYVGECLIGIPSMIIDVDSLDAWAKERWPERYK